MPAFSSLFYFPLILVSFFPLCSHFGIPNCSPKWQTLGCQLILALSPRTEAKGHSGSFPFHCHWKCNRKRIPTMSETHVYIPLKIYICRKPASQNPSGPNNLVCSSHSEWNIFPQPIIVSGNHCNFFFFWEETIGKIENEPSKQTCISERRREEEGRRIYFICLLAWKMDAAVVQLCSCSLNLLFSFCFLWFNLISLQLIWRGFRQFYSRVLHQIMTLQIPGTNSLFFIRLW